ncbi:hypothetical protein MPNT_20096 [Candidatus Methylacidithermus pantelleriae]|uniref:Uncharacterized protein n=1 Tax=Candidatus Methylacidithermus pantelleriae TaxID=2744239 RepID=A0A8J2FSF6_9BACT|nr:hypothetical protein MPNT_20096 [Candidatus Methylacidithermus pantelleriae]
MFGLFFKERRQKRSLGERHFYGTLRLSEMEACREILSGIAWLLTRVGDLCVRGALFPRGLSGREPSS